MQQAKNFALHAAIDLLLYSSRTGCLGYEKKLILQQFREGREGEGEGEAEGEGEREGEGEGEQEGKGHAALLYYFDINTKSHLLR